MGETAVDTFLCRGQGRRARTAGYVPGRLDALGFDPARGFREALRACVDTRANCRLWEE
jgi:hypothetical protein